ncbi:fumarylacetoacetate hydrolase family protein [Streptomyces sp. NPDC092952]|uniref:fumarylacetoacetate hydrolase family protein n=1 Tax=Streptomyces sp. NPDC092952 TaxID=3366018 RepID=UPI00380D993C
MARIDKKHFTPLGSGRPDRVGRRLGPAHLRGLDRQRPAEPSLSVVRPQTVAGARTTIPLPAASSQGLGWGVELGVVVARRARRVPAADPPPRGRVRCRHLRPHANQARGRKLRMVEGL